MSGREFDVVLFGATGFTGGLTADYLAASAPRGTRWALAGRNVDKLKPLAERFASSAVPAAGIVAADASDPAGLEAMTRRTRAVATTVGPYLRYGEPLVAACVAGGAHYADLTGEPLFVDRMVEKYDAAARKAGVKIVNCCGFDSIPADLGALFTVLQLPEGVPLTVRGVLRSSGTFSGGTWQSAVGAFATFRELRAERARRGRPASPDGRRVTSAKGGLHFDKELGRWVVPLPTIDPEIVKRSARALARYGPEFRYGHYASVKKLSTIAGAAVGLGALFGLAQIPPARDLLLRYRKSGEGPSAEVRARARFTLRFVGEGGGKRVVTEVSGKDPGYDETAKMLGESALCLAKDELPETAGVITTAQAMGRVLIDRLVKAGIGFRVTA
jgi:short subunit dehydrogenase-like uncharacterized protein